MNRLNSLLEALVFGARVGRDLTRAVRAVQPARCWWVVSTHRREITRLSDVGAAIRNLMWNDVGLVRTHDRLQPSASSPVSPWSWARDALKPTIC